MQHFQSILIVIGIVAIGGVLIHGYLLSRKEKEAETEAVTETPDMFAPSTSEEVMDDSVSEVRIIHHDSEEPVTESIDFSQALNSEKEEAIKFNEVDSVTSFQAVDFGDSPQPEETNKQEIVSEELDQLIPDLEPVVSSEPVINHEAPVNSETVVLNEAKDEAVQQPADLFIFNVSAKEGQHLGGRVLLQFFLTSGFRFGDMSIFHRHEHSDGTGPVLFSIANMMAPGVFDPDTMEQFKSEGVSFFLTVPNEHIDIKASFEMMLRAVEQMAEEFDCVVLNADREVMTEAQFLDYRNRLLHYI